MIGFVLLAILFESEPSHASDDLAREINNLDASSVVLMILHPMRTRANLSENDLPKLACAYEFHRGPSFEAVVETLGNLVDATGRARPKLDLRSAVIFKRGEETLRAFYFEDRAGHYDIAGFSGDRELSAKAELPERLRAIVRHSHISPTNPVHSQCSGP